MSILISNLCAARLLAKKCFSSTFFNARPSLLYPDSIAYRDSYRTATQVDGMGASFAVLILIVMDDNYYGPALQSGSSLKSALVALFLTLRPPCCNGCVSLTVTSYENIVEIDPVLILVVMDVPLGQAHNVQTLSFFKVLILVVMDVPLGQRIY